MPDTRTTISELPSYGSVLGTDRIPVDRLGAAVTAGAFVVDQAYQIVTVGSTSFTAIGAASNTVGAYFVATAAGSGSGTAAPINTGGAPLSAVAALLGGDPVGTAAAAVAAHEAAADPHPTYSTAAELSAAVAAHAAAADPHPTYSTAAELAAAVSAHEAAADPHPAYTTAAELAAAIPGSTDAVPEGSVNRYFTAARAIASALTGFVAEAGTVASTDSILQAINKIVGNIAGRALTGAIGSSGLTMNTNRILLRTTAGTGAVEEGTLGGALSFSGTTLAFSDVIKLVVSNKGETATAATNYVETTVQRACTVVGAFWELAPSATGSSSSQAMLYARRSGTKTSLLSANASLASSAILTDATSLLAGTLTLAAGDTLGVDLVSIGTGSSGHIFTITVRYS
jgi:hypothetical protein